VVEKTGLILLISYCFTMILGLLLGLLQVFSTESFVLVFWLFASVLIGYRQIKQRNNAEIRVKFTSFSLDTCLIAVVFAAISLVILSYIQVLFSAPMSGIVGGDVLDYMVAATRFSWSDFAGWSPYVWSNNFYLLVSNLAGLPMHLVYAGLQFYLVIPIAGFYFFARTIFPGYKKIAAIATMLCFFVAGVTSWFLFSQTAVLNGAEPDIINNVFSYAAFPGITPLALSPWIFDFGFLFFALAFIYRGVFKKERKLVNYFLPAIFFAAAFFSHSLNILFISIFLTAILFVFFTGCRKYLLKLSILTLAFVLALDPLSKWMLVDNMYAAVAAVGTLNFGSIYLPVVGAIAIAFGGLLMVLYVKKRRLSFQTKWSFEIIGRITMALSNSKMKLLFYIGAFTLFVISVYLYIHNFNKDAIIFDYSYYWIICRSFGIILPFALASIPFFVYYKRSSLLFTSVLSISIFISTAVSIAVSIYFPAVIPPYIGYVRYISYLVIPLSILAAFGIFHSIDHLKKRHFKMLLVVLLVILVSSSMLSQAYSRERVFDLGKTQIVLSAPLASLADGNTTLLSANMTLAIDWMNSNLPKGATILPLSLDSEKILSNLVLDVKVAPNFQNWRLREVLMDSSTEIVLYCLNTLGINYIFVDSRNSLDNSVSSIVQSLPAIYINNETAIYKTRSSLFNDLNSMPYFDSLFKKITFSLYEQYTGSTPMDNKVIWFGGMNAYGEVRVTSSNININLTGEKLAVTSMRVITSNSNIVFENKTLSDVSINGVGEIMIGNAQPVQFTNASNLNAIVDLADSKNITLVFSDANINYKDGSSLSDYRNADINISLDSANSLTALCKQPTVSFSGEYGSVSGSALGLTKGITFDATNATKQVMLWGNFTIEIPFTDNLLYTQLTSTKELNVSWVK
jgi:hypothetical protein